MIQRDAAASETRTTIHTRIAEITAAPMFFLAFAFLVCQAILIVIWVDVPLLDQIVAETRAAAAENQIVMPRPHPERAAAALILLEWITLGVVAFIWPFVITESLYHWVIRPKTRSLRWFHFYGLLFCICPSLRIAARSVEMQRRLWLPSYGWQTATQRLSRRLARRFSLPMIGIALLILPVLIVEYFLKDQIARYAWLRVALHISTGVIWFAFALEFILMVSIANKKLAYIKEHWVDLVIILLPFIAFLRSLQVMRGTRLAKLAKLPMLTKLVRVYRLRGTAIKAFRALIVLEVVKRLVHIPPERQLARLRETLGNIRREERYVRIAIARLERQLAEEVERADESISLVD
ncbi:MAG: potassium channel protein [Planctomycetota bacterium]